MKSLTIICLVALIFFHGCQASRESANLRILSGVLLVTGSEPFTNLSLQVEEAGMYMIRKDTTALYKDLRKLQGRKVRVWFRPSSSNSDSSAIIIERYELVKDH